MTELPEIWIGPLCDCDQHDYGVWTSEPTFQPCSECAGSWLSTSPLLWEPHATPENKGEINVVRS